MEDAHNAGTSVSDSTVAAHARHFAKLLELADVVIQVLDARDPMGCRSRIVEDQVRQAGGDKKMVLVINKTGQSFPYIFLRRTQNDSQISSLVQTRSLGSDTFVTTTLRSH